MNRFTPPFVAAMLAAFMLPSETSAQTFLKNTNQSRKLRSVLVGGSGNSILSNTQTAFIGGGEGNRITNLASGSVIAGGIGNEASDIYAAVGGGAYNVAAGNYCTVAGGKNNTAADAGDTVAGGEGNAASGPRSTVGGGINNTNWGEFGFIGGGNGNTVGVTGGSTGAVVAGGFGNTADGNYATVAGGSGNTARELHSTIGGGLDNNTWTNYATIGGGQNNTASGEHATVGGGEGNTALGAHSTVPGGTFGIATNNGAFVWSGIGGGGVAMTCSTNDNSFTVRAPGGVRFISTFVDSTTVAPAPGGLDGVFLAPNSGTWASLSDSNSKTDFEPIKPREILSKVAALPVTSWHYKNDHARRYIGPMAQDFHAAFGLGYDDKSISTLDSDGVMYAAIQGLVEELKERDKAMAARDETIEELKVKSAELDSLRTEFHRLRERFEKMLPPSH